MITRIYKLTKDEKGNMSIVMLGIIFFGIVFFMVLFNFVNIFAIDNKANKAAEQSSLAASGVVYTHAMQVIETYSYECRGGEICYLIDDYNRERNALSGDDVLSDNERHRKAIDNVLVSKIPGDSKLKGRVSSAVQTASSKIPSVVENVVSENQAKFSETEITMFNKDNRIEVKTAAEYESSDVPGFIRKFKEDIPQKGVGVKIPFIPLISWGNTTLN